MKNYKMITGNEKKIFDKDGYVIIRSFFTKDEVDLLLNNAMIDKVLHKHTYGRKDKEGNTTKLALWYSLSDDIYSMFAR